MTYDLRNIMNHAWKLVKNWGYDMSQALKSAWNKAKSATEGIVPSIRKQTEKAIAVNVSLESCGFRGGAADKLVWFPKSWLNADGTIPGWALDRKEAELQDLFRRSVTSFTW